MMKNLSSSIIPSLTGIGGRITDEQVSGASIFVDDRDDQTVILNFPTDKGDCEVSCIRLKVCPEFLTDEEMHLAPEDWVIQAEADIFNYPTYLRESNVHSLSYRYCNKHANQYYLKYDACPGHYGFWVELRFRAPQRKKSKMSVKKTIEKK